MPKEPVKLGDLQINIKVMLAILIAIGTIITSAFTAMNLYFTPRTVTEEKIGKVTKEVIEIKGDVKWIRDVWEKGIRASEVK